MNARRTSSSSGTSRFPSLLLNKNNNETAAVPLPSLSSRKSYVALRIPAPQKLKQPPQKRQPPSPPCVDCPICCEVLVLPVSTVSCCQKVFCFFCIVHRSVTSCPMCRAPLPSVHESFVLRSPFSDLEVKIYGDKGRWERRLMAIAGRVAHISVAAVSLALPSPVASSSHSEKKTIDSLHHSILSATGVVKSQVALYDALRKRDQSPSERTEMTTLVKTSLDAVVRLIQGVATGSNDDDDNGVARLAAASMRELFSFGGSSGDAASSSVSEQCAMFFAGGFMRRRAPSLIVVSGADDSDDDAEPRQKNTAIQNRKNVQKDQKKTRNSTTEIDDGEADHFMRCGETVSSLPSAATGQWRVQLRQRLERQREVTSTKLPVLIDVHVDDEDAYTTTTNNVATAAKARREASECVVQEVVEGSPDDTCDLVLLNAAHHHLGGRDRCAFTSHRTNVDDRGLGLSQKRAALMSADTRVQSDLRQQIKLASAYAEKKTMKSKLRNAQ